MNLSFLDALGNLTIAEIYIISIAKLLGNAIRQRIAGRRFPCVEGMRTRLSVFLCVCGVAAMREQVCRLIVGWRESLHANELAHIEHKDACA